MMVFYAVKFHLKFACNSVWIHKDRICCCGPMYHPVILFQEHVDKTRESSSPLLAYMCAVSQCHDFLVHSFKDAAVSGTGHCFSCQCNQAVD